MRKCPRNPGNFSVLFGGTELGGGGTCLHGCGILYELAPRANGYREQVIRASAGVSDESPNIAYADEAGDLFGTSGAYSTGTIFRLAPSSSGYVYSVLQELGPSQGGVPSTIAPGEGGVIDGTTINGGSSNSGVVFALVPSGSTYSERVLYSFGSRPDGSNPFGAIVVGKDGAIFGTTLGGGAPDNGTVFRLSI